MVSVTSLQSGHMFGVSIPRRINLSLVGRFLQLTRHTWRDTGLIPIAQMPFAKSSEGKVSLNVSVAFAAKGLLPFPF